MRSPGQGTAGRRLSVSALLVAAGMFLSRIAGYARTVLFSAIFGVESSAADAFNQAFKIPNFLQNLLGEGALSASLIPVYSGLLQEENQARADRVKDDFVAFLISGVGSYFMLRNTRERLARKVEAGPAKRVQARFEEMRTKEDVD